MSRRSAAPERSQPAVWDRAGRLTLLAESGVAHDLGVLSDHGTSEANDVEGSFVVGEASTEDGRATAVSFTAVGPQALADTGWKFSDANAVNARGQITAGGKDEKGRGASVLLTPRR